MESRKNYLELTLTAVVLWTGSAGGVFAGENQPPRLRRADCFLGAHFDFHAQMDDSRLGENTTEKMVNAIIDTFHPDYIEIDTKGHPGVSSYPTRIGNHANNFVGDPLRVWREVTARRGVSLYAHHSGIWDNRALALHPAWGRVLANGSRDKQNASVFGPYPDALLIPQLTELAAGWDKSHYGSAISWIENQYPVEVILASRLIKRLDEYPLVVIADWDYVEPAFVQAAVAYVNRGGRLLLIGSGPAEIFRATLATAAQVVPGEAPEPFSLRYHRVGQGLIGVIGKPRNLIFYGQPNATVRDFSASVLRRLFPDPVVNVVGSHAVDVSLMRTTRGELAVHFVNTSGPHRTAGIIDHIDPVGPLDVSIRCEKEPTRVRLVPGHRAIRSEYRDGRIHLRLDRVEIHDILVIK